MSKSAGRRASNELDVVSSAAAPSTGRFRADAGRSRRASPSRSAAAARRRRRGGGSRATSSANRLCASRFVCSRTGMFERRNVDGAERVFRTKTSFRASSRERRNSHLGLFAQILGRVFEIVVRNQLLLLLGGGRRGVQRGSSAECPLADGARRGFRARLAKLRGNTRPDEVRRLANELFSTRSRIPKLGTQLRSSRDPPNERAAARDARARDGHSQRDAESAKGAAPATPHGGKTAARAAAFTRARQSTMSFVFVRVRSSSRSRCVDEIEKMQLRLLLRTCSSEACARRGTRHDAAAVVLDQCARRSRAAPTHVSSDPAGLCVQRRVGRAVGLGDVIFDR